MQSEFGIIQLCSCVYLFTTRKSGYFSCMDFVEFLVGCKAAFRSLVPFSKYCGPCRNWLQLPKPEALTVCFKFSLFSKCIQMFHNTYELEMLNIICLVILCPQIKTLRHNRYVLCNLQTTTLLLR